MLSCHGKRAKVGNRIAIVKTYTTESRLGSYERGLKFSRSEWALLIYKGRDGLIYFSTDHGKPRLRKRALVRLRCSASVRLSRHGPFGLRMAAKAIRLETPMAATIKCLAESNKSRTRANATNYRRSVMGCLKRSEPRAESGRMK
jgi:hypothetical protein